MYERDKDRDNREVETRILVQFFTLPFLFDHEEEMSTAALEKMYVE